MSEQRDVLGWRAGLKPQAHNRDPWEQHQFHPPTYEPASKALGPDAG
jgi:hypothetical protein